MRLIYVSIVRGIQLFEKYVLIACSMLSSLIFNFTFLPFKQAIYLPIWVENLHLHNTRNCVGKIIINTDKLRPRMIRLGKKGTALYKRGVTLNLVGTLIFEGECKIGGSSFVEVFKDAVLTFGNKVHANDHFIVECSNKITIGEETSIGWNVSMIDTNFHDLGDVYTGKPFCTMTSPIVIGKKNWISSNCSISKGFKTADGVVIASGTKCSSRFKMKENSLIGEKIPCEVLEEGVYKMI